MDNKREELQEYFEKRYETLPDISDVVIMDVYNCVFNGIVVENNDHLTYLSYGLFYEMKRMYDNMIKYLSMAVELGNIEAAYTLGCYYLDNKDNQNATKYFLIAAEKNHISSIYCLGWIYEKARDYDNMLRYYLIAAEHNDVDALNNLGLYYHKIKDHDNMLKYYLLGLEQKDNNSAYFLGLYYENLQDMANMLKYYVMGSEYKCVRSMCKLGKYYEDQGDIDNMVKYYAMPSQFSRHTEGLQALESYYEKQKEYDSMMKYYLLKLVMSDDSFAEKLYGLAKDNHEWFFQIVPENKFLLERALLWIHQLILHYIENNIITSDLINLILDIDCSGNSHLMFIKKILKEKVDLMDLHFNYSMEGMGFMDAKRDFIERLV